MGSGNENVGRTLVPDEAHSFMRSTLNIDGGSANALHAYSLELADRKPSRWTCQPDAEQLAGLNHDGIGRDGAQRPNQVLEKEPAEIRSHGGDQQQLYGGSDALRDQKRVEDPRKDYEQKAEYTSQYQFNDAAGIKLVW
jgi:hypothetical protein